MVHNEVIARLRRALSGGDEETQVSELTYGCLQCALDDLPAVHTAMLEQVLLRYARAAEELGPGSSLPEIVALARALARHPD